MFSFYARTESPAPVSLGFQSGLLEKGRRQYVEISGREWTRYRLRLIMPARYRHPNDVNLLLLTGNVKTPAPVFLDALQLEPGLEPTAFEP